MGVLEEVKSRLGIAADIAENTLTGGAADWAIAQTVASQLPGRIDGPA